MRVICLASHIYCYRLCRMFILTGKDDFVANRTKQAGLAQLVVFVRIVPRRCTEQAQGSLRRIIQALIGEIGNEKIIGNVYFRSIRDAHIYQWMMFCRNLCA